MSTDTANALCSLSMVQLFSGLATSDTTWTAELESAIDGASWYLNTETKRELKARTQTEYLDGDGSNQIFLKHRPVNSIITIHSDPDRGYATSTLVSSSDYVLYGAQGRVVFTNTSVATGEQVLKVVYSGGFSTVPHDLEEAAIELAVVRYKWVKDQRQGIASTSNEGGSRSYYLSGASDFVKAVIERYRPRVVL